MSKMATTNPMAGQVEAASGGNSPGNSSEALSSSSFLFWAAAPKGRCPVGHRGEFLYVRPHGRRGRHVHHVHGRGKSRS